MPWQDTTAQEYKSLVVCTRGSHCICCMFSCHGVQLNRIIHNHETTSFQKNLVYCYGCIIGLTKTFVNTFFEKFIFVIC